MPNELWYWEKRVPDDLIPAVKHVRNLFEDARWKSGTVTQHCCYTALHPNEKASDDTGAFTSALVTLKAFIGQSSTRFFHDLMKRGTPSAILAAFFHFYKAAMAVQVKTAFHDLLAIGSANSGRLETPPIEWAAWQVKSIINSASYLTGLWLKRCCDVDTYDLADGYDPNAGEEDERVWTSWRAPRFVGMEPSLGRPFEASRVWEREDVESSQSVVKAFKEYFVIHLEARLKECVGSAHLEFAKQPKRPLPLVYSDRPKPLLVAKERNLRLRRQESSRLARLLRSSIGRNWRPDSETFKREQHQVRTFLQVGHGPKGTQASSRRNGSFADPHIGGANLSSWRQSPPKSSVTHLTRMWTKTGLGKLGNGCKSAVWTRTRMWGGVLTAPGVTAQLGTCSLKRLLSCRQIFVCICPLVNLPCCCP